MFSISLIMEQISFRMSNAELVVNYIERVSSNENYELFL